MEGSETALRRIDEARTGGHTTLVLSGLGLRELPDALRALTNLRSLDLSDNELTVLPPWIASLGGLRRLDLRRNLLVEVPWELGRLDLRVLGLDGNPHLLLPPPETVGLGTDAVLAYLRAGAAQTTAVTGTPEPVIVAASQEPDAKDPAAFPDGSTLADPPTVLAPAASLDALAPEDPLDTAHGIHGGRRAAAVGAASVLLAAAVVIAIVGAGHPSAPAAPQAAQQAAQTSPSATTGSSTAADVAPSTPSPTPPPITGPSTTSLPSTTPAVKAPTTTVETKKPVPHTSAPVTTHSIPLPPTTAPAVTTPPAVTSPPAAPPPAVVTPQPVSLADATGQVFGYGSLCLDDLWSGTQDYNPVDLWSCDGTAAQQWSWVEGGSTLHAFGMCLDVQNGRADNGTPVDLYHCNDTGAQVFVPRSDGSLFNPQSGKCLDDPASSSSPGTKLQIWDCNGGANQQWQLP